MLNSFRNVASNFFTKIFLVLIALSFVLWGVGDIFRGHTDTDVAKVGKSSISREAFDQELRLEIGRMQRRFGGELTPEQIKALKLEDVVLGRMINRKLVQLVTDEMGLHVGIPAVLSNIQADTSFQNELGKFDKKIFDSLLQNNGLNEASYVALLKREMAAEFLMGTLSAVKITPADLLDRVYRYKMQKRVIEGIRIPHDHKTTIPALTEAGLKSFYETHKQQFVTPEMRSLTYITLSVDDLLEGIATSENEARTEYDDNIANYQTPENRTVDNLIFTDEKQAKAAWEQLTAAKNFAEKAKEITHMSEKDRALGNITKADLPPEVQNVVFALKPNTFSAPVKSSLGWHIFRVTTVTPAATAPFDQVREKIITALTRKKAENSLMNYSKKLEDEFASGSTLEEVATKLGLKARTLTNITKDGLNEDGSKQDAAPSLANFLPLAFSSEEGNEPTLTLAPDNSSYFVLRVNKIIAPHARSFEQARPQVAEAAKLQQEKEAIIKLANDILRQLQINHNFEQVAKQQQLEFLPERQVERPADSIYGDAPASSPLPTSLLKEVFTLKPGQITNLHQTAEGDYIIAFLKDVVVAVPETNKTALEQVRLDLDRRFASEISEEFIRYLHSHYPIKSLLNNAPAEQVN